MKRQPCLAICAPGVEGILAGELVDLGITLRRTLRGGVEFSASDRQLYAANLWCRTATRIVVRVARFNAMSLTALSESAAEVDWGQWMPPGTTPSVRVSTTASRLYHSGAIEERVADAAGDGPGEGPQVIARLMHDRVTLSVDSSGEPLHRRGWRLDVGKAPMRETLAAAVVLGSGWDRNSPLHDPMCGSGTIAIEAALLAAGIPPGQGRSFAFQSWPSFQPGTWASVLGSVDPPVETPPITGADRDAGAVAAAEANAERAHVTVAFDRGSVSDRSLGGGPGWVVTNAPYGKRVGGGDVRNLYAALGRATPADWSLAILTNDERAAGHVGRRLSEVFRSENGGIPVKLLVAVTPGS